MSLQVQLTRDAVRDLEEICDYIDRRSSPDRAQYVQAEIEKVFQSLSSHPRRASFPDELIDIGIREYREVLFKPYRIIYRAIEDTVYVLLIADGRRDMQILLRQRLLRA